MKTSQSRQPGRGKVRLARSAVFGATIAGAIVAWDGLHNHAALVAAAAGPNGAHETVASILVSGGIFTFLVLTLVAFAVSSAWSRLRPQPQARTRPGVTPYAVVPAKRR